VGLVLGDLVTAGLGPRTWVGRAHCWHTAIVSSRRVGVTSVPCSRPSPPLFSAAPPATSSALLPTFLPRPPSPRTLRSAGSPVPSAEWRAEIRDFLAEVSVRGPGRRRS